MEHTPKALILIPSRYQSSRFPGKPLTQISGQSMIQRVAKNCQQSGYPVAVITDHDEIEAHVKALGLDCLRVNDSVETGTERIYLAYDRFFKDQGFEFVINVQGDEPLLKGELLGELVTKQLKSSFDVMTLIKERSTDEADYHNPNCVKAVWSAESSQCHYFSRGAVPHYRESRQTNKWYQHIGVYSYRIQTLKKFYENSATPLEKAECLEQLRVIEKGMTIGAMKTDADLLGVDTPEDVARIEGVLNGQTK